MLKKILIVLSVSLFALMLGAKENEVKISAKDFPTKAGKFINKKVAVEGKVLHVCEHGGMRLRLGESDENSIVVGKAKDDKEKFDTKLGSKNVLIVGIVKEMKITKERLLKMKANLEKELKEHEAEHAKADHKHAKSEHGHHDHGKSEHVKADHKHGKSEHAKCEHKHDKSKDGHKHAKSEHGHHDEHGKSKNATDGHNHDNYKEALKKINEKLEKIKKEKLEYIPVYWLEYKSHKVL